MLINFKFGSIVYSAVSSGFMSVSVRFVSTVLAALKLCISFNSGCDTCFVCSSSLLCKINKQ